MGGIEIMARKSDEGVPALQNDELTGMTEEKQEEVVRRSGRASREDAAKEFYEAEGEQARKTPASGRDSEQ
jgi:hypothetical protein